MLTLLVARFDQLDVVKDGPILDSFVESNERSEAERQTHTFLGTVMQSVIPVVAKGGLRLITGLLSLLLDRTDITAVAYTKVRVSSFETGLRCLIFFHCLARHCYAYSVPESS